jgi:Mg2+-importing ATPase
MSQPLPVFWNLPPTQVLEKLGTTPKGLTTTQAQQLLARYRPNSFSSKQHQSGLQLLLSQFKSPIIVILIFAAILSRSYLKK